MCDRSRTQFPQARVGSNREKGGAATGHHPTRLIYLSGTRPDLSTTARQAGRRPILRSPRGLSTHAGSPPAQRRRTAGPINRL